MAALEIQIINIFGPTLNRNTLFYTFRRLYERGPCISTLCMETKKQKSGLRALNV